MKHASFNQFSVDAARSLDLSSRLPSCHCGDVLRVSLNRKRLRDILRNNVVDTAAHETQLRDATVTKPFRQSACVTGNKSTAINSFKARA